MKDYAGMNTPLISLTPKGSRRRKRKKNKLPNSSFL